MGASTQALVLESLVGAVFLAMAVSGSSRRFGLSWVRGGPWHSDFARQGHINQACTLVARVLAFDLTAAYLAWLLKTGHIRAT
jgi:hypothetical protein